MTLQERIDSLQTPAKALLQGLYDDFADALWIPNEFLPEELRQFKQFEVGTLGSDDGQVYGRSGTQCIEFAETKQAEQEEIDHEAEKERRVKSYAKQFAENGEFEYDEAVEWEGAEKLAKKMEVSSDY